MTGSAPSRLRVYHEVNFEIISISHPLSELSAAMSWKDLPITGVQELSALEAKIVAYKVNGRNDDFLYILQKIAQNVSQAKEKRDVFTLIVLLKNKNDHVFHARFFPCLICFVNEPPFLNSRKKP